MAASQPFNFSWFVDGLLAGMGYPTDADIRFLSEAGVSTVVNLTHSERYSETARQLKLKVCSLPTVDFCPPCPEHIRQFIAIVRSARSEASRGASPVCLCDRLVRIPVSLQSCNLLRLCAGRGGLCALHDGARARGHDAGLLPGGGGGPRCGGGHRGDPEEEAWP